MRTLSKQKKTVQTIELSVVLPTYNEAKSIAKVIPELENFFAEKKIECEIIIVDDSSPDGTAQEVKKWQKKFSNLVLLADNPKEGIGKALSRGYLAACGEWILSMDADRSFKTEDIARLLKERKKGFDLITGSKYAKGAILKKDSIAHWLKVQISKGGNAYLRFLTGVPANDFTINFRLFKKEVWKAIHPKDVENFFLVEMLVQAHQKGFKIKEIPTTLLLRDFGQSKTKVWRQIVKFLVKATQYAFVSSDKKERKKRE